MRAVHLFVTIALSLSATAYDASRPRRRNVRTAVPGNEVDALGVSKRDLTVLSTSNTSDAHSLNMNRKREQGAAPKPIALATLRLDFGRIVGSVSFDGYTVSRAVFDTGSSTTWKKMSANPSSDSQVHKFEFFRFEELRGQRVKGVVSVSEVSSREMEYVKVSGKTLSNYGGGIALDRSATSWLKFMKADRVIAFYISRVGRGGIHLGGVHGNMGQFLTWYEVNADDTKWTPKAKAVVKVNGKAEAENIITVIDTGVRYIYGSASAVKKLYESVGGTFEKPIWRVPCDKRMPTVSFAWGKKDFPVDSITEKCDGHCCGLIRSHESIPTNTWVLGIPFAFTKYVAFDDMEGKVGFALLSDIKFDVA